MKSFLVLLLFTVSVSLSQAQFQPSFRAGGRDAANQFMGGTEMRVLTAHKGKLYGGLETWEDNNDGTKDPDIGAQIVRLDGPQSGWQLDKHFDEKRNNPQPGQRTLFRNEGVTALESVIFRTDSTGKALAKPDTILLAACRDFNGVASVYARNDQTGTWTEVVLALPTANAKATVRSLGLHRDRTTGIDMAFAGCLPQGVLAGVYAPTLPGKIRWRTKAEVLPSTTTFEGRPMAFTDCNNQFHLAAAPAVLRRIDGLNPRWEVVFTYPLTVTPGGSSGLRGLTAVPNPTGTGQSLLAALEGNQGQMVRLDPTTTLPYKATRELDIMADLTAAWKTIPPAVTAAYVVIANSKMTWVKKPQTTDSVLVITIQHHPAQARNDAFYYVRTAKGTAVSYDLRRIDNTKLSPVPVLNSTRACVNSPFGVEKNEFLYIGGYDADNNPSHNTAYALRVDVNTALGVTTSTTAPVGKLQQYSVNPKDTDPAIDTYTAKPGENHIAYVNTGVAARNQLFVFMPGSGGTPAGNDRIDSTAANLGYHSIGLMYANEPAVGTLCGGSTDADCFEKVRREIIDGTDRSSLLSVNRANSIENRLLKLLKYLHGQKPTEGWNQFYDAADQLLWAKIVVSGHSQGGGHAGVIAKYRQVARVVFFASPKDYSTALRKPAPWINATHATPTDAYFGFSHSADDTGCTPQQQLDIYNLLGMNDFGAVVNVDATASPYKNTRILTSSLSVGNAHNAVVVDNGVPLTANKPTYLPVWTYMLTQAISTTAPSTTVTVPPSTTVTVPPSNTVAIPTIITGLDNDPVPAMLQLTVYPNPGSGPVTVKLTTDQPLPYTLRITSLTGQVVLNETGQANVGLNLLTLNPTGPAGMYILSVQIGAVVLTRRLVRY